MRRTITACLATVVLVAAVASLTTLTSFAYLGPALSGARSWAVTTLRGSVPEYSTMTQVPGAPVSGDGVVPIEYDGNVSCQGLGFLYGFKLEGNGASVYTGVFPFNGSNGGGATGGAPPDGINSVSLSSSDGIYLNWAATLGIDAVIMKGGRDSNAYIYIPEDNADTHLASPSLTNGQLPQISHVEFCYEYELKATKTANGKYTRAYSWTITKDGDASYDKLIGSAPTTNPYTITVDQTTTDSDFIVAGSVTVNNPTPFTVGFSISDIVNTTTATVDCPATSIAPGASVTCTYTADLGDTRPPDGTNKATVTSNTTGVGGAAAVAAYAFGEPTTIEGQPTVAVTDSNAGAGPWSASGDQTFNYNLDFSCPSDPGQYVGGVYTAADHVNTATIDTEPPQSDTATVKLKCYAPTVTKDAATSYTRDHQWDIAKAAAPASFAGVIGGSAGTTTWTVSLTETETESNFKIAGTITVTNPGPLAMSVAVADSLPGVSLSCGGALAIGANSTATCDYEAVTDVKADGTNTATATLNGIDIAASAAYSFDDATVTLTGEPPSVTVTDGQDTHDFTTSGSFSFDQSFTCSAEAGNYQNGVHAFVANNTATINETGDSGTASVNVTCYAPSVSKTALTSYTRKHAWTIDKAVVGQSSFTGFVGQSFTFNYSVTVDETETEFDFKVAGNITISNPGTVPMSVNLDDPGANVDCASPVEVPAGGSVTCGYSIALDAKTDGTNIATATVNGVPFSASAAYAFGDATTVIGPPTVNVTDTQATLGSTSSNFAWTYGVERGCSTNTADYTNGVDIDQYPNTATITETGADDSESVTVTCYIPAKANVIKTTDEGSEDFGDAGFTFSLQLGAAEIELASTNGAGTTTFATDLTVEGSYSVVELLPAGWYNSSLVCNFDIDYPASAGTVVDCSFHNKEASRATVVKLTDGAVDPNMEWKFAIFAGAHDECGTPTGGASCASFLGSPLANDTTAGSLTGLLEFANTNLEPGVPYTMCETNVAAGWSSLWMVDANRDGIFDQLTEIVTPYNPNASALPNPQDVGNRCVTFTPAAGEITAFQVDNQHPGGDPRTIGYWRNWTACAGGNGNQVETAAKNGGPDAGFYVMENLLPQTVGNLLVDSCAKGVPIVSKQSLDGKQRSNDGAYELAAQFLAAQLNLAAGAESCAAVQQAVLDAQSLLASINFTGVGAYLPSSVKTATLTAQRQQALALAKTLDIYNNGNLCTP